MARKKLKLRGFLVCGVIITVIIGLGVFFLFPNVIKLINQNEEATDEYTEPQIDSIYETLAESEEIEDEEFVAQSEEVLISGWIAYWDLSKAINVYNANDDTFDSLSPTWYYLMPDGSLGRKNTARNSELRTICKQSGTKLIPTVSNGNADELSKVLHDNQLLNTHIDALVNEAVTYEYNGIDIDYETIHPSDKEEFSNFIKLLSKKLHEKGKVLTIAVLWKDELIDAAGDLGGSRAAQDWDEIGIYVDEFRIMAYDYTHSYEDAGPIAPKEWIADILDYAINHVPRYKIVLGLPSYAYEWTVGAKGAGALVWNDVGNILSNQGALISNEVDDKYKEGHLKYYKSGVQKEVWYQDAEINKERVELAKSYNVYKVIFWRMGGEDPETYSIINED